MSKSRQEETAGRIMSTRYARLALAALLLAAVAGGVRPAMAADGFVNSLQTKGFIPSAKPVPGRIPYPPPYYINVMSAGSTFLEELKQSIEWQLLDRDLPISRTPVGATVINLDIDVVKWGGDVGAATELVWRGTIVVGGRVVVKSSDVLAISRSDVPLYMGASSIPAMATPGTASLGPTVTLRYAR
jgi:hypothetical protein